MQTSARSACALLALCACLPPEPPAWVVGYPITWGIGIEVVEPGSLGEALEVPADRTRADVYPFDTIELQWHGAAPEGASMHPPIWIAVPTNYYFNLEAILRGEIPDCAPPVSFTPDACRIGAGERVRMQFGADGLKPDDHGIDYQPFHLLTIASDTDHIDPDTCLERMFSQRSPDLTGCLFTARTVEFGPLGPLWVQTGIPAKAYDLPVDFFFVPPNLNPVIERLELDIAGEPRTVHDGDVIAVAPGQPVALTLRLAADAAGEYWWIGREGDHYISGLSLESVTALARFSALVDDYTASPDGTRHRWTSGETATMWLQVDDGRGGRAFATLRFVADEDP